MNMGFEPILSERGNVFYDPEQHVQDACLSEVATSQLFVLIIGGRFGSKYKETNKSITNLEYEEAIKKKIPIFALVEQQVFSEYRVFQHNRKAGACDLSKISFPSVDSTKIFEFIEAVASNSLNNAIEPFSEYNEMEYYLKQQWAGIMFNFLTKQINSSSIISNLDTLKLMNEKIEFLSKQILSSVGTDTAKLISAMYDRMLGSESIRNLATAGVKVTPKDILEMEQLSDVMKGKITIRDDVKGYIIAHSNPGLDAYFSRLSYENDKEDYADLRTELLKMISEAGKKIDDVIQCS
jgi:hypothetical protein